MPTFSSDALQTFRDALASASAWFFGLFRHLLDFILSSPFLFFAVALPIAGLVFWMIFSMLRDLGERNMDTTMGTSLYSKQLDGSFTNGSFLLRNLFRRFNKSHKNKKQEVIQASGQKFSRPARKGYSNSYAAFAAHSGYVKTRSGKVANINIDAD